MAESYEDRTEAPTARRRQEAREQGNIPRSADLTSAALLLGGLFLLKWWGLGLLGALRGVVQDMLSGRSLSQLTTEHLGQDIVRCLQAVGLAMAPVLCGAAFSVIAANIAQVGFYFNGERLAPNLAALNPFRGLSSIFGRGRGTLNLVMNLLKVVLVGLVAWSAVQNYLQEIIFVQQLSFLQIFALGSQIIYSIGMRVGILLLVLAIIDYIYQRYRVEQSLRMTKQEVKDEMRRMEGDPRVKLRRRQIAIQRAMQKLKKEVPTADVVVTNPTHLAVALKYDQGKMRAPKVVAKGADLMAKRIRELAAEAGIPIVQRPPLARAIYKMVEVGQEIPEQFYSAVAEILAYVYELNRRIRMGAVA